MRADMLETVAGVGIGLVAAFDRTHIRLLSCQQQINK
jgi:hypothetical protein